MDRGSVTDLGWVKRQTSQDCRERLAPWLHLANLLPPAPLREELNRASSGPAATLQITQWRVNLRSIQPEDFLERFAMSGLADTVAFRRAIDLKLLRTFPERAGRFLSLALEVAGTLGSVSRASAPQVLRAAGETPLMVARLYLVPSMTRSEVWIKQGTITTHWVDPFEDFLAALEGTPARRIGQCPICYRFFFALRKDQKACSKRCNAARRVRDWRDKQNRHEYRRKLRTAGLLPRRKKRAER